MRLGAAQLAQVLIPRRQDGLLFRLPFNIRHIVYDLSRQVRLIVLSWRRLTAQFLLNAPAFAAVTTSAPSHLIAVPRTILIHCLELLVRVHVTRLGILLHLDYRSD